MNRWTRDQIPFPGAAFRQTVETLIRDNALAQGVVPLGRRRSALADITCPYLNVFCRRDEIVPPRSAEPLSTLVGSTDTSDVCLESGHVGLVAGRQAAKVSQPRIADWLRSRSDTAPAARPAERSEHAHS